VFRSWRGLDADALQKDITATRGVMQKYPMMAALKAVDRALRPRSGVGDHAPAAGRAHERAEQVR